EPFAVNLDSMTGFPALTRSCSSSNGTFGDPAVRLNQVIASFGEKGTFTSICQDSYAASMQVIATLIGRQLGRQCLDGVLADKHDNPLPLPTNGMVVDPNLISCSVEDVQNIGTPQEHRVAALPPCNPAGQTTGTC